MSYCNPPWRITYCMNVACSVVTMYGSRALKLTQSCEKEGLLVKCYQQEIMEMIASVGEIHHEKKCSSLESLSKPSLACLKSDNGEAQKSKDKTPKTKRLKVKYQRRRTKDKRTKDKARIITNCKVIKSEARK